jgi:predicted ABC-type ATPase
MTAPKVLVFAGPNGSGKSTINAAILKRFDGEYTNADDIAKSLESEIPDYRTRNLKAAKIAAEQRSDALAHGRSFAFETVMSTPEKIAILTQAKASGYEVSLVFVTTNHPEININRVANRARKGGHNVEPDAIRSRYHRVMALLPCAVEHADHVAVFDNTGTRPLLIAKKEIAQDLIVSSAPPSWVLDNLQKPYAVREASRQEIQRVFSEHAPKGSVPIDADARHGQTYRGMILAATPQHVLQACDGRFVIHDRGLMAWRDLEAGQNVNLRYAYDKGKLAAVQD